MSLIERAVTRMADAMPSAMPADERPHEGHRERRSSIEALADRIGDEFPRAALPGPREPPVASPKLAPESRQPPLVPLRLDLQALQARGMVVPSGPSTPTSREFGMIKRPLLANAFPRTAVPQVRDPRRIMVASCFPAEGKTFCAINLAMSIASERNHGVILVDADIARPAVPRALGIESEAGFMDWLAGVETDLFRLLLPTNVSGLSILPGGRPREHATELLASEAMGRLLEELSERYPDRIVLFDSPPLLGTTEARVLASYVGQVVMVVEAERTPRDAVRQGLAALGTEPTIGLVLNKARSGNADAYSLGYYYTATA